jgi:anti-anti-sigma regulatory factor
LTGATTRAFAFALPDNVDRSAAAEMAHAFAGAIQSGKDVTVDGSKVTHIGQAGLQILLTGFASARQRGSKFDITQPSDSFNAAARLAGASGLLGLS